MRPPTATHFPYTTLFRSLGIGAYAAVAGARARGARQERRAHIGGGVNEGFVGLDLGQRLDAPAGLFLRILDEARQDRKSTRLNSSHQIISYAVFCLKEKN